MCVIFISGNTWNKVYRNYPSTLKETLQIKIHNVIQVMESELQHVS